MKKLTMLILFVFGIGSYGALIDFEEFGVMNFDILPIDYDHYKDQGVIINANPSNGGLLVEEEILHTHPDFPGSAFIPRDVILERPFDFNFDDYLNTFIIDLIVNVNDIPTRNGQPNKINFGFYDDLNLISDQLVDVVHDQPGNSLNIHTFGFDSSTNVNRITIDPGINPSDQFYIDQFEFNPRASIPEPSTYLFALTAIFMIGIYKKWNSSYRSR